MKPIHQIFKINLIMIIKETKVRYGMIEFELPSLLSNISIKK
ncbi:hypothetical protein BN1195_03820 [Chryseobacterium oranimense G311]|nr:hypothetical protein BN1195_03820 [Chryseobacterium oranimense G311]